MAFPLRKTLLATGTVTAVTALTCLSALPAVAAEAPSPKNVIVMIGDGMGYNHIDNFNAITSGEVHWQVETGSDNKVQPYGGNTAPTESWQSWDHVSMSTHWSEGNVYDTQASWGDFEWNKENPTDSAAAGTAMATGVKTYNAGIGVDTEENEVENLSERAKALGKSAGVVSSVPFSHATPAAYSAHDSSRQNLTAIANDQVTGDLDVVMGTGHPMFDDNAQARETGNYKYISQEDYAALADGSAGFSLVETNAAFAELTSGETPERVFGIPQVGETLQQSRAAGAPKNDVVDLQTMTEGALNVLDNNEDGFMLMVEGGAIDWAGHANQTERDIEEVEDFDNAVSSVIDWVNNNSNWDETLVVVTADHETGYLYGNQASAFSPIVPNGVGEIGDLNWNSGDHTNQLAPFFFKGAGSDALVATASNVDLIRGHYLDNTDMAQWLLNEAWVVQDDEPEAPALEPTLQLSAGEVKAGSEISGEFTGFPQDGKTVISLHSDPVILTEVTADVDGAGTFTATIPADTTPGAHRIIATSGEYAAAADLNVLAADTTGGSDTTNPGGDSADADPAENASDAGGSSTTSAAGNLAETGQSDDLAFTIVLIAIVLLGAGATSIIVSRRNAGE